METGQTSSKRNQRDFRDEARIRKPTHLPDKAADQGGYVAPLSARAQTIQRVVQRARDVEYRVDEDRVVRRFLFFCKRVEEVLAHLDFSGGFEAIHELRGGGVGGWMKQMEMDAMAAQGSH